MISWWLAGQDATTVNEHHAARARDGLFAWVYLIRAAAARARRGHAAQAESR